MNRAVRALLIVGVGSVMGLLGASSASAQVDGPMTFKTWFPFTVNGKTLPAGTYTLRPAEEEMTVLELTSRNGRRGVFFEIEPIQTKSAEPARLSEVVFMHDGDQYLLKDVWIAGEETGAEAPGKLTEQHVAANGSTAAPEEVRVAAIYGTKAARGARS